jgi:hypothetical protein
VVLATSVMRPIETETPPTIAWLGGVAAESDRRDEAGLFGPVSSV